MLERDCTVNRVSLGLQASELPTWQTHKELLTAIAERRTALVKELRSRRLPENFEQVGYAITQQDADTLRNVGVRLNETSLGPPRVKQG